MVSVFVCVFLMQHFNWEGVCVCVCMRQTLTTQYHKVEWKQMNRGKTQNIEYIYWGAAIIVILTMAIILFKELVLRIDLLKYWLAVKDGSQFGT